MLLTAGLQMVSYAADVVHCPPALLLCRVLGLVKALSLRRCSRCGGPCPGKLRPREAVNKALKASLQLLQWMELLCAVPVAAHTPYTRSASLVAKPVIQGPVSLSRMTGLHSASTRERSGVSLVARKQAILWIVSCSSCFFTLPGDASGLLHFSPRRDIRDLNARQAAYGLKLAPKVLSWDIQTLGPRLSSAQY